MSQSTTAEASPTDPTLAVAVDDGPTLPAQDVITGRGLAAGTSGAGKSNTATVVAEEVLELGVPLVVLDPEGEFVSLREEYPVIVFGDDPDADVSGDADDARELARHAVAESVPVVFDLSGYRDETAEGFAGAVASSLFFAEKRHEVPMLLIVDELDEFLPNKRKTEATKPLQRVAQRGRKRGLGFLGVSQRPAEISKGFVTQAEYHLWHRLKWDNDQDVARSHLSAGYGDDLGDLADGEVILNADWTDTPEQFFVRLKSVTDLGATPSIERSLGTVPDSVPDTILDDTSADDTEESDESDESTSCDDCPFCRAGVEPPAHVAEAASVQDGTVLGVYKARETREQRYRVQIDGATFLRDELGLSAGDTVGVSVIGEEVRLNPDGDGLLTYTVGEGSRYLSLVLSGRALECLAVEPGDHVRVVDRGDRITLERVTGRADAMPFPVLAREEPYCKKGDDDKANQVTLPTTVTDYLGLDANGRIGVEEFEGRLFLVPPDEASDTFTVSDRCPIVGASALRKIDAREGDTLVVTPVGPHTARLTNGAPEDVAEATENAPETVYVPVNRYGTANDHYHTDPDCRHLGNADKVTEKSLDTLFDYLEECGTCSGEAPHGGGDGDGHIESLRRAAGGDAE